MPALQPRTWAKLVIGVLLIGGVLVTLWAIYQPGLRKVVEPTPEATPVPLQDARAVVTVRRAGAVRAERATIACDGARRSATGFWAREPRRACDALASTKDALLASSGCSGAAAPTVILRVTGAFAGRQFAHRAQRDGCSTTEQWLSVNVLASPVLLPDREAQDPAKDGG